MVNDGLSPEDIRRQFDLEEMPLEGGFFRQTWRGSTIDGRPSGTAILVLLSVDDGQLSAMHRLPTDEIWFFHAGGPVELLLLEAASGDSEVRLLGNDLENSQRPQITVPAGTWMGGRPVGPIGWSLYSCTMTPGFMADDYDGGDAEELGRQFPQASKHIKELCRPGAALKHPRD